MIYENLWPSLLTQTLRRQQANHRGKPVRLVVVGIGNEMHGDDAAGVIAARQLNLLLPTAVSSQVLVLEGGNAPENHTGQIRRFGPDVVLLVDMALMGKNPGDICWVPWEETSGLSASSHTMPLYMLGRYLTTELGCEVALIGIEPQNTHLDEPLTAVAQQAVKEVVQGIADCIYSLVTV